MLHLIDYWESDLNRATNHIDGSPTMPYTSAQNFYPPCICCEDTCSGWRIIRRSIEGKVFRDWACIDCVKELSNKKS